jgi:hypothetical protein
MLIGDRFEVQRELGKGGFGTTYAAIDRTTGREVAVKLLDLHRVSEWKAVELFEREAKVLRSLDHPGIPAYIEFRPLEDQRQAYLVQGLAPGHNLLELLETRRFTEAEIIDLARRVLDILGYLTSLHPVVVHRDVKPANILLDADGTVSLVDFGAVRDIASATMTGGSTVAGTFGYMAPEQLHGAAQPSSDLYGLGMTLIHLATGRAPSDFDKKRLKPDFRAHVHFSRGFEDLIDRLIEPIPDDRFHHAAEVLAELDRLGGVAQDDAPSATAIASLREQAERTAVRATPRPAPTARAPHRRVTFEIGDDAADLTIGPSPYWRNREVHLGLGVVAGPLCGAIGAAILGTAGAIVGVGVVVLVLALLWLFPVTTHLRMTSAGDFIYYTRNARSPRAVGRTAHLTIETLPTQKGGRIGRISHGGAEQRLLGHVYPMSAADAGAFSRAKRWADSNGKSAQ